METIEVRTAEIMAKHLGKDLTIEKFALMVSDAMLVMQADGQPDREPMPIDQWLEVLAEELEGRELLG